MEYQYETDSFPFVKAKHFKDIVQKRQVRLVVIHTTEALETGDSAEGTANYFKDPRNQHGNPVKVSSHLCIDNNSIVQCVWDNDVAYCAPGVNSDGIHLELAATSAQTAAQWADPYSTLVLEKAANAAAQYCLKYDIPRVHLSNQQLRDGKKGIIGHYQATAVYPPNAGHTDPGANFPWDSFVERVETLYQERKERLDNEQALAAEA
jgi:N-acetyl-anhydromuramyl-L-alanine amidase AmpD